MSTSTTTDWRAVLNDLLPLLASRAATHDNEDSFVADNYADLRERRFFSMHVPLDLGGGGVSYAELCSTIRELAHGCSSTALSFAMHSHVVATSVWRWRYQQAPVEPLLRRIASEELVVISTGASDWLDSSCTLEKVEGGFRLNGRKRFASGAPGAQLMMTSAVFEDPANGATVCQFSLPMRTEGLKILDNWHTLGMRGTGSHDIAFEGVFIADAAIAARRPKGQWIPFFDLISMMAVPPIMAAYVGLAEAARDLAVREAAPRRDDVLVQSLVGELENELATVQGLFECMVAATAGLSTPPTTQLASTMLARKTPLLAAMTRTVEKAFEIIGGKAYFRSATIERLHRDAQAARFHPLTEAKQRVFTGRVALGLPPV